MKMQVSPLPKKEPGTLRGMEVFSGVTGDLFVSRELPLKGGPMQRFRYGTKETRYLSERDPCLGSVIRQVGMIEREVIPDLFSALVHCIVSQQVSIEAAAAVFSRLLLQLGEVTPRAVVAAPRQALRRCGLSARKAEYIMGISESVLDGSLDLQAVSLMPDQEVVRTLCALRGVGPWTAEMLLIFSLERPDVVSYDDLAIRRGMMKVYGLSSLSRPRFQEIRSLYSPYGSVASLYLWAAAHD